MVGAGHAGAEAAQASARIGAEVLLITMSRETIAKASCNPAIGGLAKGQIVNEVDALGGIMGRAADATGIQFRLLNISKGPAVRSPRAQIDKYKYSEFVRNELEHCPGLTIFEGVVTEILVSDEKIKGVQCKDGSTFYAATVILTTGTFLSGLMHTGQKQWAGGRSGEPAANELSESLRRIGLEVKRLKTGTPPPTGWGNDRL